jgi:DNA-binding transcriptional regulator GbsR (MarR family)
MPDAHAWTPFGLVNIIQFRLYEPYVPDGPDMPNDAETDAAVELVEKMGLEFEADGGPRIAGRILGYLLLSPQPRSLDRMARDLLVSKTSASTNARLLERRGALERVSRPGDRRDFYRISPNLHLRILARSVERIRAMSELMETACTSSPRQPVEVQDRLRTFGEFFDYMLDVVSEARRHWESEHDHADAGPSARAAG